MTLLILPPHHLFLMPSSPVFHKTFDIIRIFKITNTTQVAYHPPKEMKLSEIKSDIIRLIIKKEQPGSTKQVI